MLRNGWVASVYLYYYVYINIFIRILLFSFTKKL